MSCHEIELDFVMWFFSTFRCGWDFVFFGIKKRVYIERKGALFTKSLIVSSNPGHGRMSWRSLSVRYELDRRPRRIEWRRK